MYCDKTVSSSWYASQLHLMVSEIARKQHFCLMFTSYEICADRIFASMLSSGNNLLVLHLKSYTMTFIGCYTLSIISNTIPHSRNALTCCYPTSHDYVTSRSKSGCLPLSQKTAMVMPCLKKSGLDPAEIKNYRPISNLPFMSNVIEKLILAQLTRYLTDNGLFPKF